MSDDRRTVELTLWQWAFVFVVLVCVAATMIRIANALDRAYPKAAQESPK